MLISINKMKMSAFLEHQPFLTTQHFVCTTQQIGNVIFVSYGTEQWWNIRQILHIRESFP